MLDELHNASTFLRAALNRYINACSALRNGQRYSHAISSTLDCISNELNVAEFYKSKLSHAQAEMKKAKNNLAKAPINTLPVEVLAHIFHLILSEQPCPLRARGHWGPIHPVYMPKYPDTFTHVCSQWQLAALASPLIWSHVDIALSCPLSKSFHGRAEAFVTRAHQAPLDIHFIDPGCYSYLQGIRPRSLDSSSEEETSDSEGVLDKWNKWKALVYDNNPKEFTFLTSSPSPQIRSLGLLVHHRYHPIHYRALEHCLSKCLPGGLSELVVIIHNPQFSLSDRQLEDALHPVTTLELRGRYPRWTSTAYHGLTDLRLLGSGRMSGPELAGILRSSPGLRVFYCSFRIDDSPLQGALFTPLALHELEKLDLTEMDEQDVESFLVWLDPGANPLRLALHGDPTSTMLTEFFARSNVQEMRVGFGRSNARESLPLHPAMFCLPPQLRILVIANWNRWSIPQMYTSLRDQETDSPIGRIPGYISSPTELDALYMLTCTFTSLRQLQRTVAKYSPRRLILWRCLIYQYDSGQSMLDLSFLESELGSDLSQFFPHIECLTYKDPKPIQDWDQD